MKRLVSFLLIASISVAALAQQPQPSGTPRRVNGPKANPAQRTEMLERMQAEKIAFITTYVGLTPDEAQVFWPLYNEIEAQQKELQKAEYKAFRELEKCLKSGEGNSEALLNDYLAAKKANINLHLQNVEKYKKFLPIPKVCKLFTSEEQFRRNQIGKLRGGGHQWNGPAGPQGGKPGFQGGRPGAPKEGGRKPEAKPSQE